MRPPMTDKNRKHPRFGISLPIRFNLNPDYHHVPSIRKMGVGGTVRSISVDGLMIDSKLDLLDVCQIFSEATEDQSVFEFEMEVVDTKRRPVRLKGRVRWYKLSEGDGKIRHFRAGIHIRDAESRAVTRGIVKAIMNVASSEEAPPSRLS